jgi:hypothetical protein
MTTETQTAGTTTATTTTGGNPFDISKLPQELQGEQTLTKFKSVDDLAKGYVNLEKMMGAGKDHLFRIPKDGNVDGMKELWKQLGKPDKYEFPADLKTQLPDDYKAALTQQADKLNFTQRQWEELLYFTDKEAVTRQTTFQTEQANQRTAAADALKGKLGAAYDQTINLAKDVTDNIFQKPDLWKKFEDTGLTTDPDFIEMMSEIGRLGGEDRIVTGNSGGFVMTPAQAQAEVNTLRSDEKFMAAWLDRTHPTHREAVERMAKLKQLAFSG